MDDAAKQAEEELSNIAGKCLYLLNKMIKCFSNNNLVNHNLPIKLKKIS